MNNKHKGYLKILARRRDYLGRKLGEYNALKNNSQTNNNYTQHEYSALKWILEEIKNSENL